LLVLLEATSPFRTLEDIDGAVRLALKKRPDAVVSVCLADQHPHWMKRITPGGWLANFLPIKTHATARQLLPPAYYLNGAVYVIKPEVLARGGTFFPKRTCPYVMPFERSLDIDTPVHFHRAELIMRDLRRRGRLP